MAMNSFNPNTELMLRKWLTGMHGKIHAQQKQLNGRDTTSSLDLTQIRRNTHITFSVPSLEMFLWLHTEKQVHFIHAMTHVLMHVTPVEVE